MKSINTEAAQAIYGFVSAALMIGVCILVTSHEVEHDVSEEMQWMTAICLPTLLWAVILAGAKWLFG